MSFILNALKKSEHDRLVSQEKTLLNKISGRQQQKEKKTPSWLFFLVIINVFFFSYFIWFFTKDNNKGENLKNIALNNTHKIDKGKTDISKNTITKLTKVDPKQSITEHFDKQPTTEKSIPSKQSVIESNVVKSDIQSSKSINRAPAKKKTEAIIALNELDVTTENTKIAISKNPQINTTNVTKPKVLQTNPSGIQINQLISESPSKKKSVPIVALKEMDIAKIKSIVPKDPKIKSTNVLIQQQTFAKQLKKPQLQSRQLDTQKKISENEVQQQTKTISIGNEFAKIDNAIKTNQPPFLSDLDYEFRRTVPNIKINVYVYSENKNKRFIMINMTKFVPGQEISEGMILNEILMNSIIVDYDNRIFQINRN